MSEREEIFRIMHDKGEKINGIKLKPYDTFKSILTSEFKEKVDKGFLQIVTSKTNKKNLKKGRR